MHTKGASALPVGVAIVVVALTAVGCAASKAADSSTRMREVGELRTLEQPTVRALKTTFVALTSRRDVRAAAELERAATDAGAVLRWLDGHRSFVRANRASVDCLGESLGELRERAEELMPVLRARAVNPDQRRELQRGLGETVNCIQSSD